jgi:sugar porter (SP) family MFS transporter
MTIGSAIIILGAIVNGTTVFNAHDGQLLAGRFVLGFGVSIVSAAGPIYVVETAHPAWRGIITAYCNTFWFTGSILAAGAVRGGLNLAGNTSWTLPIWLQLFFPGLIIVFVYFIPESPRWLFVNNRREQAVDTLSKWHGYGNRESAWVKLQVAEYDEYLNTNGADKRFWDYSALFKTRASRYRIAVNCIFSIFCQWAGNGVLSYFLPAVLTTAGYTEGITQANINLGYACFQFAFALFGAAWVDRIGRRPLMLFSMTGCCVVWVAMTIATSQFAASGETNDAAAKATVACIFLFGAVFSVGLTPLQALYPVEVLSFEGRAKGMAFSALAVNAGGLLNQFAWPISLQKIGWRTYIVFCIWCAVQAAVFYFFMPETKNRTLEELDMIFESKNPVKTSLMARKVAMANDGTILASEDA